MKQFLFYILLAVMAVSCSNSDTVNILISNRTDADVKNVVVKVACADINKHLIYTDNDSLYLLNETNADVIYHYTAIRDSIVFTVPIIKSYSQKNYSLNVGEKKLEDNLFRFRAASIQVSVGE